MSGVQVKILFDLNLHSKLSRAGELLTVIGRDETAGIGIIERNRKPGPFKGLLDKMKGSRGAGYAAARRIHIPGIVPVIAQDDILPSLPGIRRFFRASPITGMTIKQRHDIILVKRITQAFVKGPEY